MRCQQKTACITLVFFCFYPALAESQSQKSQIWRIPVLPSETSPDGSESKTFRITPEPERASQFDALMLQETESKRSAHSAVLGSTKLDKGGEVKDSLQNAGVSVLGAETISGDSGKISLRAFSGQAPLAHVDSVPMSSGFSSAGSESLIPTLAIQEIELFPLVSPSGLPRRGNAGGFNLRLKAGDMREQNELFVSVSEPRETLVAQLYSPSCDTETWYGCVSSSWQLGSRTGLEKVRDDNNTPLIQADDTDQPLRHNSRTKLGGHLKFRKVASSGAVYETTSVLGFQSRGLNGIPVRLASPSNRAENTLYMLNHSGLLFSPITGNIWSYALSGRYDDAVYRTRHNMLETAERMDGRSEQVVLGRFGVSRPLDGIMSPRFFISGSYERNSFKSQVDLAARETSIQSRLEESVAQGKLESLDFGAGVDVTFLNATNLRTEVFFQWTQVAQKSECGVFAPRVLCESELSSVSRISPGASLEVKMKITPAVVSYGLLGRTVRLPRPFELMGRPDGVLPNRKLRPESSDFVELGLQSPYFHAGAFFGRDTELITLEQVSPYLVQFKNRSDVRRTGFFGQGEARYERIGLQISYERVWAWSSEQGITNLPVPFVPSSQTVGKLTYRWSNPVLGFEGLHSAVSFLKSGDYFLDRDATYLLTPPYRVDCLLHGKLLVGEMPVDIGLTIRNVFDNRVSSLRSSTAGSKEVGWSYLPTLPITGRSVVLSLNLKTS